MVGNTEVQAVTSLNGHTPNALVQAIERKRSTASHEVVLTGAEVARLLRLRPSTVADMARRGDLPSVMLGRHRRFIQQDILAWLDGQRG